MNAKPSFITRHVGPIVTGVIVTGGLLGFASESTANCFGYPESSGCIMNGIPDQKCVGTKGSGNVIQASTYMDEWGNQYEGCSNAATSPLRDTHVCVMRGLGGPDVIVGTTADRNVICGGSGNDAAVGGGGNDVVYGNDGADVVIGQGGTNYVDTGAGDDTVLSGGGDNLAIGGSGVRDVCQPAPAASPNARLSSSKESSP